MASCPEDRHTGQLLLYYADVPIFFAAAWVCLYLFCSSLCKNFPLLIVSKPIHIDLALLFRRFYRNFLLVSNLISTDLTILFLSRVCNFVCVMFFCFVSLTPSLHTLLMLISLDYFYLPHVLLFPPLMSSCLMNSDQPFGGKIVVLLGDFRQTCPVIPGGTRSQVIDACIQSSPLWTHFQIRRLQQMVRNASDPEYANFVNVIGDGQEPDIPLHLLSLTTEIEDLISFVFPATILRDPYSCLGRGIIAPTNLQVDEYNSILLRRVHGMSKTFLAADSLKEAVESGLISDSAALDYVARRTPPGMPAHSLTIKTNAVFRLLRNFSVDQQLVKNVRVLVTDIGHRIVTVKILRDRAMVGGTYQTDQEFIIPRINFTHELPSGHTLLRRQFPLAPAYCSTIHSCQGLTYSKIGIDLTRPVFTHGQLYTALSRIRKREDAKIRIREGELTTKNITYNEILLP
jgi:ATP-dependent DNA helicase PIF1